MVAVLMCVYARGWRLACRQRQHLVYSIVSFLLQCITLSVGGCVLTVPPLSAPRVYVFGMYALNAEQ